MHNTYIYSTVSLRSKGSLTFSVNDYSNSLNDMYEKSPHPLSSSSSSCCARVFPVHRVPINPSFVYGLRQSTLIQFSASRNLILRSGNPYCCRFPVYDIGPGCCFDLSCTARERAVDGRRRGRKKERWYREEVTQKKGGSNRPKAVGDAEAVLSLLTEELGESCHGEREKKGRRVQVRGRGNVVNKCFGEEKKGGLLESNLPNEFEPLKIKSGKEENGWREEKESPSSGENRRVRKGSSSCSSYYSFSSSGDFESESEFQLKREGSTGVSPRHCADDSGRTTEAVFVAEGHGEEYKKFRKGVSGHDEVEEKLDSAVRSEAGGNSAVWDWRKRSEKKLAEVVADEINSMEEFSKKQSGVLGPHQTGYTEVSSYDKSDRKDESYMDVRRKKQYRQIGIQVSGISESSGEYQQHAESATTSKSQEALHTMKENLVVAPNFSQETRDKHGQKAGYISHQPESGRNSEQFVASEMRRRISNSNRQSEISEMTKEGNATLISSSNKETQDQHHQTGRLIANEIDSRKGFEHSTEILNFQHSDIERTLASQSQFDYIVKNKEENVRQHTATEIDSRKEFQHSTEVLGFQHSDIERTSASERQSDSIVKNKEGNQNLVLCSLPESEQQHLDADRKAIRRTKSKTKSTSISTVQGTSAKTSIESSEISERKMISQEDHLTSVKEDHLTSVMKSVDDTKDQTDGSVLQIEPGKEAHKPGKLSSFREATSKGGSGAEGSLSLVGQARVRQISRDEEVKKSSQTMVMSPPSQLVTRASLPVQSRDDFLTQEASNDVSGSGSGAFYTHPQEKIEDMQPDLQHEPHREELEGVSSLGTSMEPLNVISHEDVMGSAGRMEKLSMQFVGDFVEKVHSEVSTSEILEEKFGKPKAVYEGEKHRNNNLSTSSGEDFKRTEPSSRHSSTMGPSVDTREVLGPTVEEPFNTEASEGAATDRNSIAKRSSRSLWSIVADIVRLRWASHADPNNSAVKLGGRTSSNESSEAWYSGHEADENSDETARKRKKPQEPLKQMQPAESPHQTTRLGSDASITKEKLGHFEVDRPSSSSVLESHLASGVISLASGSENIDWSEDGKGLQGASSSPAVLESSLLMSSRSIRSAGNADALGRDSIEHMAKPIELLGTEGKDGELKRGKLQRRNQLLKDSFDEWEEAYKLESKQRKIDEMFMREALLEAKKAADNWEVPVGAVLVQHGKVIARGCNLVEELRDSTAHAEMICIREASNLLKSWRLADTTLYVTLEPCPMCAGAILQARIDTLVWGAPNKLLGADGSWIRLFPGGAGGGNGSELTDKHTPPVHPFHPKMAIRRGVLGSECADAMQQFFQRRRKKGKKAEPTTPPSCLPVAHHPSKFMSKIHNIFHALFCL